MHNIVLGNIQLILSIIKKKCFWPSTFFYLVSIIKDYSVGNVCKTKASCVSSDKYSLEFFLLLGIWEANSGPIQPIEDNLIFKS